MADNKTYRHRLTGKLGTFSPALASEFPDLLKEVAADAKPLAYTPIPAEVVADAVEEADLPAPSPTPKKVK